MNKNTKKIIASVILIITLVSSLSACACEHEFGEWSIVKESTCTENGTENRKCNLCDFIEKRDISTLAEHTYGDWTETKKATCTEEGEKEQKCNVCQQTQTEKIAIIEHDWEDATCTLPKTCNSCGETTGNAAGHSWKDATCEEPETCIGCDETQGEALGHSWNAATCTKPKTCSNCYETQGSALGHSWKDATCSSPKTCKTCGTTSGTVSDHKLNSQGKCSTCGKDVFLEKIQNGLKVELIVPSPGTLNYYCEMKVSNATGYDIVLNTKFLGFNDRLFTYNGSNLNYTLKSGRYVVVSFYRGIVDIYDDRYRDTYMDRMSEANYNFKINGKTVFVKFGVNGSVRWGYSLADIGVY